METSIIIRVKNEVDNLKRLLSVLQSQTYQDFEIVIVNDHCTDGSDALVFEYFPASRVQVVSLDKPFGYAYASNVGAASSKGKYLVYLSAHSLPFTLTWLADGLRHMLNERVAGVYAMPRALPDTNFIEKLFINIPTKLSHSKLKQYTTAELGVLGATNAIFRKDLWQQYPFSEDFAIGGEDFDWANHFLKQGYIAVHDPAFRVYHSHRLGLIGLIRQAFKYRRMLHSSK